jgi:FAD/FMN-containing dehydrogenase
MVLTEQRRSTEIVDDIAVGMLARRIRGNVISRHDPGYDAARAMFNAAVDRRPAVIVQPADAADVSRALSFARLYDLPLAARGGGHSTPGYSIVDDGLLLDLSLLKSVEVDPVKRVARAGGGLRAGEYITEVERFGLVSPIGDSAHTGLGGLTLGGGYGWLSGSVGMAVDSLVAAEVVTADGIVRRVSNDENPDLFWALRGGSGNFGVVTHFEFALEPISQVYGGMLVFPYERAGVVLRGYRDFNDRAPDEVTTYAAIAAPPGQPPVVILLTAYSGEMSGAEQAIAPLRALGPVADTVGPMPYSALTQFTEPFIVPGFHREDRWPHLDALSDETIDALIALGDPARSHNSAIVIRGINGKAARVAPDATAFPHRRHPYSILPLAMWPPDADATPFVTWVEEVVAALRPITTGIYVNGSVQSDDPHLVYGSNYERLVALKNRYDPENLFHGNYNIVPTIG